MKKALTIIISFLFASLLLFPLGASAEDAHEHTIIPGNDYTPLEGNQHLYPCECGINVIEDCAFELCIYNDEEHWFTCTYCTNESGFASHTMQDCECTEENCAYQTHQVENCTLSARDQNYHVGICTVCNETIEESHFNLWAYDENEHWYECVCGVRINDYSDAHELSDSYSYNWIFHYRYCGCGYEEYEKHADLDKDGYCDTENCERELCVDTNGDHECDDCGQDGGFFCTDANGDHTCEGCGERILFVCVDANGDHTCDHAECARHMIEVCVDEDYDYFCDECERNCCNHSFYEFESNGDGTHTSDCYQCGEFTLEESCDGKYSVYSDANGHAAGCICGYEFEKKPHTYHEKICYTHSLGGHFLTCDECFYEKYEAHTAESGTCDVCGDTLGELFDVYVGGIGLKDGFYLSNAGKTSETKPEGGYAYYHEGVLELNGFSYEGEGALWQEETDYFQSRAALFIAKDVTLRLVGDNLLSCTFGGTESDEESKLYQYGDGIAAVGKVTVEGDGSLTILSTDDGINFNGSDFIVESGTLTIGKLVRLENGSPDYDKGAGDDGIDLDDGGSLLINGGTIQIVARDQGIDVSNTVTLNGGTLTVFAGDDGIEANGDILIGFATVTIDSYENDMESTRGTLRFLTEEDPAEDSVEDATEEGTEEDSTEEQAPPKNEDTPPTAKKEGFSLTAVILIASFSSIIVGLVAFLLARFINQKKNQVPKK